MNKVISLNVRFGICALCGKKINLTLRLLEDEQNNAFLWDFVLREIFPRVSEGKKSSIHVLRDNLFFELGQVLSRFLEPHSGGFVPISHSCLKVLWEITGILELFVCLFL